MGFESPAVQAALEQLGAYLKENAPEMYVVDDGGDTAHVDEQIMALTWIAYLLVDNAPNDTAALAVVKLAHAAAQQMAAEQQQDN